MKGGDIMKEKMKRLGLAVAGATPALFLLANSAHAQILSATQGSGIVDDVQTEVGTFLTTTLPLVLIGLVVLAWIFKMYNKVRRGR